MRQHQHAGHQLLLIGGKATGNKCMIILDYA